MLMVSGDMTVRLPREIGEKLGAAPEQVEAEVLEAVVLRLFSTGEMSGGKAAEVLGRTLEGFLKLAGRHGIPFTRLSAEELARDAEVAARARKP